MRSATSSSEKNRRFYPALWKKNMARFWPIWAVYALGWLVALPMALLLSGQNGGDINGMTAARYFAVDAVRSLSCSSTVIVAVVFAILSAMAVFSYLYSSRSVAFFHALPLRREDLFFTNYLSGLSFTVLPALAVFLLTLLTEAALGVLDLRGLLVWLAVQVLVNFFFFSFAVFCAMFTGHILALPAFYGILNVLAVGLLYLINQVLSSFVYGYVNVGRLESLCEWLSPFFQLMSDLTTESEWSAESIGAERLLQVRFHGMGTVLIYALVGVVLTAAALWLYRRRHLEGAGDVVTVAWSKPLFKYGVGVCAALSVGQVLYQFFAYVLPKGGWPLLGFLLVWGAVGYFVAEMLLQKKFWVFKGSWKGCVGLCLAFTCLIAVMELDLTGFERRTPDPDRVVSVEVDPMSTAPHDSGNGNIFTTDPDLIRAVVDFHQAVVDEQERHEDMDVYGCYEVRPLSDGRWVDVETAGSSQVTLRYTLIGGDVMQRRYYIALDETSLADPDSAAGKLSALLNRPEAIEEQYFPARREEALADGSLRLTGISLDVYNTETGAYAAYPVPVGWREEVIQALKDDIAHGDLGRRYLMDDMDRMENCYYTDLELTYQWDDPARGDERVRITLQTTSVETLDTLREAGILDSTHILETQLSHNTWEENEG
ncbi:ABC-2 transporter permease [Intestinimonas sp. HCP28S3_D6]|uniref:ABC-2 transporter permease n=1 Tax=Intestinimonas sp. HCP28S3_D6 TaxID=3438942 RepID=UPI003F8CD964